MNRQINRLAFTWLAISLAFSFSLVNIARADSAGIKLPQTRVIFQGKNKDALATIQNRGGNVYLIKASVLPSLHADGSKAPFIVTPPLFRLEPHNQQTVRIVSQGTSALPIDRESLFYLSFLAIPSTPDTGTQVNRVAIGLQTVIKLFYRPERLAMTAEQAADKLQFKQADRQLLVNNPTPYYLTLGSLHAAGKAVDFGKEGQMIAPFSQQRYSVTGPAGEAAWTVINDYGGLTPVYRAKINPEKGAQ